MVNKPTSAQKKPSIDDTWWFKKYVKLLPISGKVSSIRAINTGNVGCQLFIINRLGEGIDAEVAQVTPMMGNCNKT